MNTTKDLNGLIENIRDVSFKYDEKMEYHYITYNTILQSLSLFSQNNMKLSDYIQQFMSMLEFVKAYNGDKSFGESFRATVRKINNYRGSRISPSDLT